MQKLEKPKFKHNKKRNTAFLFEAIVKELTKAVVYGDKNKQKVISTLLKEHFKKNGVLDRELTLYKQFYETRKFPKQYAEKLLNQIKNDHDKLDENEVYNEQSKLIAKVNKMLGVDVYNNFVPNYKTLATVSQIFNTSIEPKKRILLEQELIEHITGEEPAKVIVDELMDKGVYNRFVHRFNETYSKNLLPEQKQVLSRYITCGENDIDVKIYLGEEISRLKKAISDTKNNDLIKESVELKNNLERAHHLLSSLRIDTVNEELIKKVMLIQEFVHEVNK